MPHCPECGESIDAFADLEMTQNEEFEDNTIFKQGAPMMYSCKACGVVLGFSDFSMSM